MEKILGWESVLASEFLIVLFLCLLAVKLAVKKPRNSSTDWWAWYSAYLRSAEWKMKREGVLLRSQGRCEKCDKRLPIQVHHLTYERVGNELPEDLAALCFDCHRPIHPGKRF
jgi:5-methylcytosine-specific restriction endonuclease McrA